MYDALDATRINYKDSSDLKAANVNLGVTIKDLNLRFIYDELSVRNQNYDGYTHFDGYYLGADYAFKLSDKLTITPKLNYKRQERGVISNQNSMMIRIIIMCTIIDILVTLQPLMIQMIRSMSFSSGRFSTWFSILIGFLHFNFP